MTAKKKKHGLRKQWPFYVMMAPGLLYLLVNNYGPISGLFIAFKQIDYTKGIFGSPWVGLKILPIFQDKCGFPDHEKYHSLQFNIYYCRYGYGSCNRHYAQ